MKQVYKPHVTAQEMSLDGWSRGFDPQQTLEEMTAMGIDISLMQIENHWKILDEGIKKPSASS